MFCRVNFSINILILRAGLKTITLDPDPVRKDPQHKSSVLLSYLFFVLLTPCSSSVVIVERDVVKISRGGKKKPREKEEIQGEEDI